MPQTDARATVTVHSLMSTCPVCLPLLAFVSYMAYTAYYGALLNRVFLFVPAQTIA
jgi:hypothetical protein